MNLKLKQPQTLLEISKAIGADLVASGAVDSTTKISCISGLETAEPGSISFLSNPIYKKYLPTTKASAVVLLASDRADCAVTALVCKDPRLALAKLLQLCDTSTKTSSGIHPSAVIGINVKLGSELSIGPNCVVGNNVQLGDGIVLQAGVIVGDDCNLGPDTELKANVTLYNKVTIGKQCTIHSGTVIGSDGFGYAVDTDGSWFKMLHLGGVVIGNNVEIGSNTSIDRGMLDNTVIGDQVIIDNLVQIAHNVNIGDRTAIAGCVGIAGSTSIGKNCLIGGACNIVGHIVIGDRVTITGASSVSHSLLEPGVYSSGFPAKEYSLWRKNVARFMFLDSMAKKIRELEKAIKQLVNTESI